MLIRDWRPEDVVSMKEITAEAFTGVAIDYWIEQKWGPLGDTGWVDRKLKHIDQDVNSADARVLVAESETGAVVGYISTRLDRAARLGWIPNLAVRADYRGQGLGRQLLREALAMFRAEGMEWAKIETLEMNEKGSNLYPSMGFQEVCKQIHYLMPLDPEG